MKENYPCAFNSEIVKRMYKGKEFDSFVDSYNSSKLVLVLKDPTDKQYEMAESAKKIGVGPTCAKFKVENYRVQQAINKVARHAFLRG